jgi:hypothetical protein
VVAAYNAPLLLQNPPGNTLTKAQYIDQVLVTPELNALAAQAIAARSAKLVAGTQAAADANDNVTLNKIKNDLIAGGYPVT